MSVISTPTNLPGAAGALAAGSNALTAAGQRLDGDAARVATPGSDPTAALIDSTQALLQSQAAVSIIRTANATLGTLLDIRA